MTPELLIPIKEKVEIKRINAQCPATWVASCPMLNSPRNPAMDW